MKRIIYPISQFELVVKETSASIAVMLERYLTAEGHTFRTAVWKEQFVFNILCDDFMDAAKVETCLHTLKP